MISPCNRFLLSSSRLVFTVNRWVARINSINFLGLITLIGPNSKDCSFRDIYAIAKWYRGKLKCLRLLLDPPTGIDRMQKSLFFFKVSNKRLRAAKFSKYESLYNRQIQQCKKYPIDITVGVVRTLNAFIILLKRQVEFKCLFSLRTENFQKNSVCLKVHVMRNFKVGQSALKLKNEILKIKFFVYAIVVIHE